MVDMALREELLVQPVEDYFTSYGYMMVREVQFFSKYIDLFGFNGGSSSTVAVELKVRNWRRAIKQAKIYSLCANRVYIAMPYLVAKRAAKEMGSDCIGVLAVHTGEHLSCWRVEELMAASESPQKREDFASWLVDSCKVAGERDNGC